MSDMISYNRGVVDVLLEKSLTVTISNKSAREIAKNSKKKKLSPFSLIKSMNAFSQWHVA